MSDLLYYAGQSEGWKKEPVLSKTTAHLPFSARWPEDMQPSCHPFPPTPTTPLLALFDAFYRAALPPRSLFLAFFTAGAR